MPGKNNGPVVVIELPGEEVRAGKTVILRAMVTVVFMGRDSVTAKAIVLRNVSGQAVVMAEENCLTVPGLDQFGRNGAVERPHRVGTLGGETWMKLQRQRRCGIDAGIQTGRNTRIVSGVSSCLSLGDFYRDLRRELAEALMRPYRAWRTSFNRPKAAAQGRINRLLSLVGLCRRSRIECRYGIAGQNIKAGHGLAEWLHAKQRAGRRACRNGIYAATRSRGAADEGIQSANRGKQS